MKFSPLAAVSLLALSDHVIGNVIAKKDEIVTITSAVYDYTNCDIVTPKVFIISMFSPEADIWYANMLKPGSIGDLFAKNVTVPGFSMLFPQAHCLADGSICQLTTGESEINAATTIASLVACPQFNLTETYFLIAGIAGINPKHGTTGSVALSKYAIQVALQYEFDAREIPSNFTTGYFPQGSYAPDQYPTSIYGTEVFELNEALRDIAASYAASAMPFNDTATAASYRSNYLSSAVKAANGTVSNIYAAGAMAPGVIKCDTATSDVYFSGTLLGEAFENTTTLFTNGSGIYCMTAQEDNATLEAMVRAAINGLVDFSRIILMRTASDFDRPYVGISPEFNLLYSNQDGFDIAIDNIYIAGVKIVQGIVGAWDTTYKAGIPATNYIGDIFGSLGGTPDFGPGSQYGGEEVVLSEVSIKSRRDMYKKTVGNSRRDSKGALGFEVARKAQL